MVAPAGLLQMPGLAVSYQIHPSADD